MEVVLTHMLDDNGTAWMTLVSLGSRQQVPPAALCLACFALSWGGLALGGLLVGWHSSSLATRDLQVLTPFCPVSA